MNCPPEEIGGTREQLFPQHVGLGNPKLVVYKCYSHDHVEVTYNGDVVISNDYSVENIYRLAKHLKWEVEVVTMNRDEFERCFA